MIDSLKSYIETTFLTISSTGGAAVIAKEAGIINMDDGIAPVIAVISLAINVFANYDRIKERINKIRGKHKDETKQ